MQIARLELVRVRQQQCQIGNAVVAAAGCKSLRRRQRHQGRVTARTAAGDGDPAGVGEPRLRQIAGSGRAIGDIGDAPLPVEALAIGAAIAGAAPIVDVEHREATARIKLHAQLQAGVGHAGGPTMRQDQGGRQGAPRSAIIRVHGRIVDAVDRLPLSVLECEHLATADEPGLDEVCRPFGDRMQATAAEFYDGRRCDRRRHQGSEAVADSQRIVDACGFILRATGSSCTSARKSADFQNRHPAHRGDGSKSPVGVQCVTARTEHPLRPPEFGAGGAMDAYGLAFVPAIELAPAGLVPGEVELTVGAPLGLEHRAAIAAGNASGPA